MFIIAIQCKGIPLNKYIKLFMYETGHSTPQLSFISRCTYYVLTVIYHVIVCNLLQIIVQRSGKHSNNV